MKKHFSNPLLLISVFIYVLACFMPAYVEARSPGGQIVYAELPQIDYSDCFGWSCLLDGIALPFTILTGQWGTLVWIANVYYLGAIIILINVKIKRKWPFIMCAITSIIIGLIPMFFTVRYVDRDYLYWIESLLAGYYLWLLSFITLFVGLLINYLHRTAKRLFSLICCIVLIPICVSVIVPTLDKGDNTIILDEESQNLVASNPINTLIIDDGKHHCFLKWKVNSGSAIALKDIISSYTPIGSESDSIDFYDNNIYEITNATHIRASRQKIRIEIGADGKAKSVDIPNEDGDNSFYFDIATQCLVTNSYFGTLVIESEKQLFWLESRGLKRNKVPINNLGLYFEENDTILPLKTGHYIINNCTHSEKNVHRMTIHLNEDGVIDSLLYLPPKKYV